MGRFKNYRFRCGTVSSVLFGFRYVGCRYFQRCLDGTKRCIRTFSEQKRGNCRIEGLIPSRPPSDAGAENFGLIIGWDFEGRMAIRVFNKFGNFKQEP